MDMTQGQITLAITLDRTGETWTFQVKRLPQHWKSWLLQKLPYGTDTAGGVTFSRTRA